MRFCDDCVSFIRGKCVRGYKLLFKEPKDVASDNWGYFNRRCKEYKEAPMKTEKDMMLERVLAGNPDDIANFGAVKPPAGFKIMKLAGEKPSTTKRIYYFIKYTGEYSIPTTKKEVFQWIKQNRSHHGE